nr:ABC transporter transmembrane domain-containing protein [Duganella margarita]
MFRLPLRYFETRRIGTIVAHVRELEIVRQFITGASVGSMLDCMSIIILVPLMFYYSSSLAWVVLASLPIFIVSSLVLIPMMRERLDVKFRYAAENQSFLVEGVSGIQTIKSLAVEPVMEQRWEKTLSRYIGASYRASLLAGMGGTFGQLIQKAITLAILWLGAEAVLRGEMSVGQLIAFQMLSGRVVQPIVRIAQLWQEFQQVAMSIARIGDIMNTRAEPHHIAGRTKQRIYGEVVLEDVSFAYQPDGPLILNHLSLRVAAGQTIGIVGRSGSGKSTLSRLLQRLYQPGMGKIMIDGVDIRLIDPAQLRSQIGVVLQENFLFDGSISDNIAIHFPSASMDRVIAAARTAGAHDFIMELAEGYDTKVGERGLSLSGGQRQRIAIARALIGNPRILVFDEATSALDYESERIIQDNLREICHGRTVFIIAHRLSTVQGADSIVVLDRGSIAEEGPHQQLIDRGGLYTHLFSQQAGARA